MKQRIPLTHYNIEILLNNGITAQELDIDFWVNYVISNEEEMNKVFRNKSQHDIVYKIRRRAYKLMRKNLRQRLGLPGVSGSMSKQKRYHQRTQKLKLKLKGEPA